MRINLLILFLVLLLMISVVVVPVKSTTSQYWSCKITVKESSGYTDIVTFGERYDASDGQDIYDAPNPPPPMPPMVDAYFYNANFSTPYDKLMEDWKHFSSKNSGKKWILRVVWLDSENTTVTLRWNSTKLKLSEYSSITLYDTENGNLTDMLKTNTYTFHISPAKIREFVIKAQGDKTPPVITVISPREMSYVHDSLNIYANATDNIGVAKVEFYIDNNIIHTDYNSPYQYSLNTSKETDGEHIIRVVAYDEAGNTAEESVKVIIDNTPPVTRIFSINPKEPVEGEDVTVSVNITDNTTGVDRAKLWYRIGGASWISIDMRLKEGVWKAVIPGQAANAKVEYYIEAYDKAGNMVKSDVYSYVVKAKPTTVTKIPTTITVSVSKGSVKVGEEQVVTGRIDPSVSGVEVTITYVKAGGVKIVHKVSTASDGSFKDVIKPDAGGTWTVKASWEGNEKYEGAVSEEITFEAVERRCIVATATYGSELAPEVQFLRGFRENVALKTYAGKEFMKLFNMWYYSWSPYVASVIWRHQMLRPVMQIILYPLLGILHISTYAYNIFSFNGEFAIFTAGLTAAILIGLVYFTPLIGLIMLILRSRKILLSKNMRNKILKLLAGVWIASILLLIVGELYSPITLMIGTGIFIIITITIVTGMITLKIVTK